MKEKPIINLLNEIYYYYYIKYITDQIEDYKWEEYKETKRKIMYWLNKYDKDTTKDKKNVTSNSNNNTSNN